MVSPEKRPSLIFGSGLPPREFPGVVPIKEPKITPANSGGEPKKVKPKNAPWQNH